MTEQQPVQTPTPGRHRGRGVGRSRRDAPPVDSARRPSRRRCRRPPRTDRSASRKAGDEPHEPTPDAADRSSRSSCCSPSSGCSSCAWSTSRSCAPRAQRGGRGPRSTDVDRATAPAATSSTRTATVLADSVMRYDIAVSPKNATRVPSCASSPIPTTPTDRARRRAARAVRGRARRGPRTHRRAGAGHHRRRARRRTPSRTSPTWRSSSTRRPTSRSTALDIPWVVPERTRAAPTRTARSPATCVGFVGTDGDAQAGLELSAGRVPRGRGRRGELPDRAVDGRVADPRQHRDHEARRSDGGTLKLTIDSDLQCSVQQHRSPRRRRPSAPTGRRSSCMEVEDRPAPRRGRLADGRPQQRQRRPPTPNRGSRAVHRRPSSPARRSRRSPRRSVIDAGMADPLSQVIAPYRITCRRTARTSTTPSYHERRARSP